MPWAAPSWPRGRWRPLCSAWSATTHIVVQDIALRVTSDTDGFSISYQSPSLEANIPALQDTLGATILRLCRDAYGPDLPLREAQLTHPWQGCSYERFFGCPVRYESDRSGLTFSLDAVRRPLPAVNREMAKTSDRILSDFSLSLTDNSITGRVRRIVMDGLSSGKPSARDVARALALAARTFQRKLQEEGTTFQAVSDAVRKDLAIQYVVALARAPKAEGAGIAGVMQHPQHPRMRQLAPQHLSLVRPMKHAPREGQALRAERLDRGRGRTDVAEGAKELAHTLLDARVGVQTHPSLGVVDKADGQAHLQLAAPRLVENAPAQPRAQDMQFRLAHRALQT
jgi:hypothetical protein